MICGRYREVGTVIKKMWMDIRILTCLLYGAGVVSCSHTEIYEYQLIKSVKTWSEALQYCRKHYADLATFKSLDDVNRVKRPSWYRGIAWIGLFDDPASWKGVMGNESNSWRWSATGNTSPGGYQKWASGQPDYYAGTHQCMTIVRGLWHDSPCSARCRFACFTGSTEPGNRTYTLVNILRTKPQAQSHCRHHYTDLAMIENESENTAVANLYPGAHVWTGLYRKPWRWSDGSPIIYTNWLRGHPNNYRRQEQCVIEHTGRKWNDAPCYQKRHFICQAFASKKRRILMKLQADIDLSETAVHTQLIQQVGAELAHMGITDVALKWKSPPMLPGNLLSIKKKSVNGPNIDTCTNGNATYS